MVLDFLDFLGFPDFLDFLGFPDFHSKRNLHLCVCVWVSGLRSKLCVCVCGSAAYVVSKRNRNMKMSFFSVKKNVYKTLVITI